MKNIKLTKKLLKQLNACEDGIDFFERNKLEGFPLSKLNMIRGDYEYFIEFIENLDFKLDDNDNVIYHRGASDIECWQEFDDNGNIIHRKDSTGYEYWQEFDDNGNVIHHKDSTGYEYWKEFDDNGNIIHRKDSDEKELWQEFDANGNLINLKNSHGLTLTHISEFYPDGQLKRYGDLYIPYFNK